MPPRFETWGTWFFRASEFFRYLYALGVFAVVSGGVWVFGHIQEAHVLFWIAAFFFLVGLVATGVFVIKYAVTGSRFVQLYTNRDILRKRCGSLKEELKRVKGKVWIIWHTGKDVSDKEIWDSSKIERLILFHPKAESMTKKQANILYPPIHAPISFNKNLGKIKGDIVYSTKRAISASIPVKWFDYAIGNTMIISNPETGKKLKGRARIELSIPYSNIESRPTILIKEAETPELFRYIVDCYKQIWNTSVKPSTLDDETGDENATTESEANKEKASKAKGKKKGGEA